MNNLREAGADGENGLADQDCVMTATVTLKPASLEEAAAALSPEARVRRRR